MFRQWHLWLILYTLSCIAAVVMFLPAFAERIHPSAWWEWSLLGAALLGMAAIPATFFTAKLWALMESVE